MMDGVKQDLEGKGKGGIGGLLLNLFFPLKLLYGLIAKNLKVFGVLLLILFAVGGTLYLAKTKPELIGISNTQVSNSQAEVGELVKAVGKLITLPEGEIPTLATVTDVEKVKGQTFFAKAQNGDRVLIYHQAKRAYLYRPSEKKIIEVGFVNFDQEESRNVDVTPSVSERVYR